MSFSTGETNARRNSGKAAGRVQHDRDNGESRGEDAVRYRSVPRVRANELPHGGDEEITQGTGFRPQGNKNYTDGYNKGSQNTKLNF